MHRIHPARLGGQRLTFTARCAAIVSAAVVAIAVIAACGDEPEQTQPPKAATPSALIRTVTPTPTLGERPVLATPSTVRSPTTSPQSQTIATYGYRIVNTFPHDPEAFTQGLEFDDGVLFEGTGLNGRSSLRRVDLETGEVQQMRELSQEYFGEGITVLDDRIYQLTWRSQTGFVYDKQSFELLGEFSYPTEGWGLTNDGTRLIMSDGTSTLYFRDPDTFAEVARIEVRDDRGPLGNLNELEYIDGEIYANVRPSDMIVRIDPATGLVTGRIDLSGLLSPEDRRAYDVEELNGITCDSDTGRILVTGKLWPKLFEIELIPQE